MLESILAVGQPAELPTHEAPNKGSGGLCQIGVTPNLHRGAVYLPFAPNGINWVKQETNDIVSWNFTGCIMAAFTFENIKRVAHISTGAGQDCLPQWAKIKEKSTNVFEFKPSDFIETKGKSFVGCYGLITPHLDVYSITIITEDNNITFKVASIVKARLLQPNWNL